MPYLLAVVGLILAAVFYLQARGAARTRDALAARLRSERVERDGQAILLARMLRHSFLNDLQIITGWLQLGNVGRAGAQAEHVRDRLAREGQLMRVKPAGLVMGILNRGAWAEANGVKMTYVVAADLTGFEDCDSDFAGAVSDALGSLIEAFQAADGHECTCTVGLASGLPVVDVAPDVTVPAEALPACGPGVTLTRIDEGGRSAFRLAITGNGTDGD